MCVYLISEILINMPFYTSEVWQDNVYVQFLPKTNDGFWF